MPQIYVVAYTFRLRAPSSRTAQAMAQVLVDHYDLEEAFVAVDPRLAPQLPTWDVWLAQVLFERIWDHPQGADWERLSVLCPGDQMSYVREVMVPEEMKRAGSLIREVWSGLPPGRWDDVGDHERATARWERRLEAAREACGGV